MNERVSVVIPTFNYGRFLAGAIESVLAQTFPIYEIFVIDDCSTDETELVIKAYKDKVVYIKQPNSGVGSARNNGARLAGGDFLTFLDADDMWDREKTEKQIEEFRRKECYGVVGCGVREFDSQTNETIQVITEGKAGWVWADLIRFEESVIPGPGSSSMIRRRLFEAVGGYDEDRMLHPSEDWELSLRLARKQQFGFIAEPLVNYRNHGTNAHLKPEKMERSMRTAWTKAFSDTSPDQDSERNRSYGNLYKVLAGSYLHSGQYIGFARNLFKSLWFRPSFLGYYLRLLFDRMKLKSEYQK